MEYDFIECGDCLELMKKLPDECIDLVVTSPPYDNLRTYNGYTFDFENIAKELFRILKKGGVCVWVVSDATINGSETGTSFRQALFFKECGFNLHDTMIWEKPGFTATGTLKVRYGSVFEYMFVFSKDKPKTFHPIKDRKNKYAGKKRHGSMRQKDGSFKPISNIGKEYAEYGQRFNVWHMPPNKNRTGHPAMYPIQLAKDHIVSWSDEGDVVLDPFIGSGTTAVAAVQTNRHFIGYEISEDYCDIARRRLDEAKRNCQMELEV